MKPRDFLSFFKTKSGRLLTFALLFAGGLIIFSVFRKHHTPAEDAIAVTPLATNNVGSKPQVVQSVVRPLQPFHPPAAKRRNNGNSVRFPQRIAATVAGGAAAPV